MRLAPLSGTERALLTVVALGTLAVWARGLYALIHTDELSDVVTVALLFATVVGWVYAGTRMRREPGPPRLDPQDASAYADPAWDD